MDAPTRRILAHNDSVLPLQVINTKRILAGFLPCLFMTAVAAAAPQMARMPSLLVEPARTPAIDGVLDEPVWSVAPVHDVFYENEPRNGEAAPPHLRTTVQLLIDKDALVFGVRAWDSEPGKRRGSLARRDKVEPSQDFVGIWIDPTGHGRAAQFVRINTSGVLSDGVHRADDDESDLGPDFPVDAAVRLLPDGYSMEVRWPLSSLRFPYTDGKNWRVMIERSVPHADGLMLLSTPLERDALHYLAKLQEIGGMGETVTAVRDRRFLELKPELTMRRERIERDGSERRESDAALGLDVSARPRADWVFNATLNPDYSQVEVDAPTSAGASQIALSLPEKRGFFLESSDVLGLPLAAFYSRTVADPQWGLRATWRGAQADATAMSLRDQEGGVLLRGSAYATQEYLQTESSLASLARTRWHGGNVLLGAFAARRDYGDTGRNDVAGIDGQWRSGGAGDGQQHVAVVAMRSRNTAGYAEGVAPHAVPARTGSYLFGKLVHSSSLWGNMFALEFISPGFVNDNGFVPQTGIVKANVELIRKHGRQRFGLGDATLELYEFETFVLLDEVRTLSDPVTGQRAGETIVRNVRPGIWFFAPRQTRFWTNLALDRQRGRPGGRLHDTPGLNFGIETSPLPWVSKLAGEFLLGRQLDVDADRVGPGGKAQLDIALRFGLPRGWAVELDHHWNRAWVRGTLGHDAFVENGWRWLGILHFTPRDSLRLLVQDTTVARRGDGVTPLDPWAQRQAHRSILYRHLWRHGRSLSIGYTDDTSRVPRLGAKALTFKWQWEV